MRKAVVYYQKSDHLTRIMTGIHLLEQQHLLDCKYILDDKHDVLPQSSAVLEMQIAGKRIAFDLRDASALHQKKNRAYLEQVDAYFERSHVDWRLISGMEDISYKIFPYGFNYYSTYAGNPAEVNAKVSVFSHLRSFLTSHWFTNVDAFEGHADISKSRNRQIIYMTRLWDPAEVKIKPQYSLEEKKYREGMICERQRINSTRIEICRRLKERYGKLFCGGIQNSKYAQEQCPDLILPRYMTVKSRYISEMKKSAICIGSAGLEKSIGWKTGEYIAAARAIVCEEMAYIVPGDFTPGKNYLSYTDAESCLTAVDKLYNDFDLLLHMQQANERYYAQYLRPDIQIKNALRICGIELE